MEVLSKWTERDDNEFLYNHEFFCHCYFIYPLPHHNLHFLNYIFYFEIPMQS